MIDPEQIVPYTQELYKTLFQEGKIKSAKKLFEFTNIKPKVPEEIIQEEYIRLIQKGWIDSVKKLNEWLHNPLKKEIMQEGYKMLIKREWITEFKNLLALCV